VRILQRLALNAVTYRCVRFSCFCFGAVPVTHKLLQVTMPETHEAGDIHYGCDDEPAMHIQRPSSARSQDVTHILVRTFRELFTRDTIAPDVVQYLNTSRCSDDEYHKQYVDSLMKV
jgi:hypothetical protein